MTNEKQITSAAAKIAEVLAHSGLDTDGAFIALGVAIEVTALAGDKAAVAITQSVSPFEPDKYVAIGRRAARRYIAKGAS